MRVYDWARAHLVIGGVDFGAVLGNLDPNTVAPARSLAVPWWGR